MTRPLVALTGSSAPPTQPGRPTRVYVNDAYVRALQAAGLVPVVVPPSLSPEEARALLAGVSGLVLSGGEDVSPALYGAAPHPATQSPHTGRDATEIALVHEAREARLPVLAICRGFQLLNVALGGSLIQDLPTERPGAVNHAREEATESRVHGVTLTAGSRLAAALGETSLDVNSLHHQAVDRLAPALRVAAVAPDGIIEAAETTDDWWVLAVQWHPEELIGDPRPWDRGLFAAFAARLERELFAVRQRRCTARRPRCAVEYPPPDRRIASLRRRSRPYFGVRILHLDSGRDWRGGQRQVYLLAAALRDDGHEPLVVAALDSPLAGRLKSQGIACATMAMRADWDLLAMRRVRRLVRKWGPDLVHAHDARAHAIALGALVGSPIKLVVTRRLTFVPKGRVKYGPRVARFIAISHAVQEALARGGVPASRTTIVYSGVPAPVVTAPRDWRREAGFPADAVVCGVVGAMTAKQGIVRLTAIARALAPAVRSRVRLVLLGGSSAGADDVGGIAAYRAGFVDAIHDAMAGLDVLWHPSGADGLGTAVIDAMALGVPPVAFAAGGLAELVEPGQSGLLAPVGDTAAFARDVERLVLDPALRHRLGEGGRTRARQFGVRRMVDGTSAVYRAVIGP